jgi:4,5-dihydroxyphthalate decarboxylase
VDIWKVDWTIAPVDQPGSGTGDALPGAVRHGPVGKSLVDLTVSGELDVMVTAFLPPWFYAPDSPVVHMIPDFPAAEEAHMRRVGYMPAHHLLTIRRDVFEANPWIARSLTDAFQACKDTWQANRRYYGDTTPFGLAEIERSAAIFGDDWNPYGLEANLKLLTDFTQDQLAQGLVTAAVNPREAFADYTRAMGG